MTEQQNYWNRNKGFLLPLAIGIIVLVLPLINKLIDLDENILV